jgi:hypothetical protein
MTRALASLWFCAASVACGGLATAQTVEIKPEIPGVAPEYQEAARQSSIARRKIAVCQKRATEQKILPRDRTKFVLDCIDAEPR